MKTWVVIFFCQCAMLCCCASVMADPPKIATFPLGGTSPAATRDRVGFAIRAKLNRDGAYDAIDGPTMADMASTAKSPVDFDTAPDAVKDLAQDSGAVVLIWGDLSPDNSGDRLRLKTLDLRDKAPAVRTFEQPISDGEHIRFVVEQFLQTLPGVTPFTHPSEEAVQHDAASDRLFTSNPNLVVDGDFSTPGHWDALYRADKYPLAFSDDLPDTDKIVIYRQPGGNALAMKLSYHAATNNGLAALSDPIDIQPGVRYRLGFKYKSDGPSLQVFVKGYISSTDISGHAAELEVYRLQVPPSHATGGQWQPVEADVNPHNPQSPVYTLRVDLYAYEHPGNVLFEDVVLKAVGRQPGPAATQP